VQFYSSDLKRAWQTAQTIADHTGVQPVPELGLREFNNGLAANKTQEEAEQLREPLPAWPLDWQPWPQSETWRQFYQRTVACMERLVKDGRQPLLLVTHGGTIVNIVAWWLELDAEWLTRVSFATAPTSITVLRLNRWQERTIERLNDTAHLYGAGLAEPISLA
jgi:probable phosphoglycerate mutase